MMFIGSLGSAIEIGRKDGGTPRKRSRDFLSRGPTRPKILKYNTECK